MEEGSKYGTPCSCWTLVKNIQTIFMLILEYQCIA